MRRRDTSPLSPPARVLVTGATGFVGRALRPALLEAGYRLRSTTRSRSLPAPLGPREEWITCDVLKDRQLAAALEGVDAVFYLVHSLGKRTRDFRVRDARAANGLARAAAAAGVKRIVYLGGVAPALSGSAHLRSRKEVGEVLRAGQVLTLELRAAMIVGPGSVSWQLVRDLARRLPAMILPAWTRSRLSPIAIDDVITALVSALQLPLAASECFDLPGPELLSAGELLGIVAALDDRRIPTLRVPLLTVSLSSWWLRLISGADFSLARELVLGLAQDLLPRGTSYWARVDLAPQVRFDEAARRALAAEPIARGPMARLAAAEEHLVRLLGQTLKRALPG